MYSPNSATESSSSPTGKRSLSNPASPSCRQLADDLRKTTSLLLERSVGSLGSSCSSPNKGTSASPTKNAAFHDSGQRHGKSVLQVSVSVEQLRLAFQSLKQQCESDRETCKQQLKQFERTLASMAVDPAILQKHAELQGSVNGVLDEVHVQARRFDSLDERVNARIKSAEESMRQQTVDLENQLHEVLQESRVGVTGLERSLEEQSRQLAQLRSQHSSRSQESSGLSALQQQCSQFEDRLEGLQRDIESLTQDRLEVRLFTSITSSLERSLEEHSQQFEQEINSLTALQQQGMQFDDRLEGLQHNIDLLTRDRVDVALFTAITSSLERTIEEQSQQFQQEVSTLTALQQQCQQFESRFEGLQSHIELIPQRQVEQREMSGPSSAQSVDKSVQGLERVTEAVEAQFSELKDKFRKLESEIIGSGNQPEFTGTLLQRMDRMEEFTCTVVNEIIGTGTLLERMDEMEERYASSFQEKSGKGVDEASTNLQAQVRELSCNVRSITAEMNALQAFFSEDASTLRQKIRENQRKQDTKVEHMQCQSTELENRMLTLENSVESVVHHVGSALKDHQRTEDRAALKRLEDLECHSTQLMDQSRVLWDQMKHIGEKGTYVRQSLEMVRATQESQIGSVMYELNGLKQRLDSIECRSQLDAQKFCLPASMSTRREQQEAQSIPDMGSYSQGSTLHAEMASVTGHVQSLIQDVINLVPLSNIGR